MQNTTMYCLCLHNKVLPVMEKLGYVPVGLGNDDFSEEWLKDNTLENISEKNKYYAEYTFHYWFWKNIFPKIKDNHWIGFCAYRTYWSCKKNINQNPNFIIDREGVPNTVRTKNTEIEDVALKKIPLEWEKYDAIIGEHYYVNNLKLSKLFKHGLKSLIKNPLALFKSKRSIRFHFDMWHGNGNMDKAIDLLDSNDREDFRHYVKTNVSFSYGAMFVCRSKKIINNYYNSLFPWLKKCEEVFGFDRKGYSNIRIYAFLAERYQSYWFNKYTKPLLWPVIFYDITKLNENRKN